MKKLCLTALSMALIFISMASAGTEYANAAPYTSAWNDFTAMVPDGWTVRLDNEGDHYTNTQFNCPEPFFNISIRWYTRYAVINRFKELNGELKMYVSGDDFINQLSMWYGAGYQIEQPREIDIGGKKAKRFVARLKNLSQGASEDMILNRRVMLGGLIDSSAAKNGGRQTWTVIPSDSGFYVLAYFAPDGGHAKYEKLYEHMTASFALFKDGPGGKPLPGIAPPTAVNTSPVETSEHKLQRYASMIKQQRASDAEPVCNEETGLNNRGDVIRRTVCRLFATMDLRKEIIAFVETMKPAPAIPDQAQRYFIQGNTILKAVRNAAEYKLAINKYKEALIEAPWWGAAYNNLAIALSSAGQAEMAKQALELYIRTKPKDSAEARNKIIEIEAQQELKEQREAELKAKYGGGQGGGFGWEALFRYGAVVKNMSFDASGNERSISLKIVTRKENGLLNNYFQIADITSRNDTFLQKFSMDWRGTNTFYLDDRRNPNKYLMTLSVTSYGDGDANITIRPSNNASAGIQTSLSALLKERAGQAVYAGDKMNVGGRDFYILGQGGPKGSLLFFPPEVKDNLERGSVRDLMPLLVANVNYRGSDGSNKIYTNSDLGTINGVNYHLEHNGRFYEAKVGRGEDH